MTERFRLWALVCSNSGLVEMSACEGFQSFRDIFAGAFTDVPARRSACRYAVLETPFGEIRVYDLWSTTFAPELFTPHPGDFVTYPDVDAAIVGCVMTYDKPGA